MTLPEQLAQLLAQARADREEFHNAWALAVEQVLEGESGAEREDWRAALNATRDAWGAAWDRRPATRHQRGLVAVANDPERVALDPDELAAVCDHCDTPLRAARGPGAPARYCGARCRRDASAVRVSARAAA